jgi:hypothetical protein
MSLLRPAILLAILLFAVNSKAAAPEAQFFCEYKARVPNNIPAHVDVVTRTKVKPETAEKLLRHCLEAAVLIHDSDTIIGFVWYSPTGSKADEKIIRLGPSHDHLQWDPQKRSILKMDSVAELEKAVRKKK